MRHVRNILILVGIQSAIIIATLLQIEYNILYLQNFSLRSGLIIVSVILIPFLYLLYMNWLERRVMTDLIEEQTNQRLKALKLEQDIRNHEVFRELQMIKVIAESECYERLDEFLA